MSLSLAGGSELDYLQRFFPTQTFYDSVIRMDLEKMNLLPKAFAVTLPPFMRCALEHVKAEKFGSKHR